MQEDLIGLKSKKTNPTPPSNKKQISWVPFTVAVGVYFVSKLISVLTNFPVDMYMVVIIIAALTYYFYLSQNNKE